MSAKGREGAWYYTEGDLQQGPVGFEVLASRARDGLLNPRGDMVWGPGLAEWTRSGEVEGLFERKAPQRRRAPQPQEAPAAAGGASVRSTAELVQVRWPGVNRRGFFLWGLAIPALVQLLLVSSLKVGADAMGPQVVRLATFGLPGLATLILLWAVLQRFANLGMTRWWLLGLVVPLLNVWLGFRMIACPPGYACFRKLDRAGWVLALLYWLAALVSVLVFGTMLLAVAGMAADPARWEEVLRRLREVVATAGGT